MTWAFTRMIRFDNLHRFGLSALIISFSVQNIMGTFERMGKGPRGKRKGKHFFTMYRLDALFKTAWATENVSPYMAHANHNWKNGVSCIYTASANCIYIK